MRRLTVPVTIARQGPFQFLIDTGAQATVVSRELADRLSLTDRRTAVLIGAASRMPVETTTIMDLALGSRVFDVQVAPLVDAEHLGGGAQGILGLDALQDQRVLFDFRKPHLAVASANTLGGNRGFEIIVKARRKLGQLIITRAKLDGIRVAVIVDTGAQGSLGNLALLKKLKKTRILGDADLTDVNGQTLSGPLHLCGELEIDKARLRNLPVLFADSPTFASLGLGDEPALILGMQELRLFRRVAIDFKAQRVLFDLPPAEIAGSFFNGNNE